MSIRRGFRKLRLSISSRVDALFPSRSPNSSTVSLPNQIAPGSGLSPPGRPSGLRSDVNVSTSAQENMPHMIGEQPSVSPPGLVPAGPTGEATSPAIPATVANLRLSPAQASPLVSPEVASQSQSPAQIPGPGGWAGLAGLAEVLDHCAGAFSPLKAVTSDLLACTKIFETAAKGRTEFIALHNELDELFRELQKHYSDEVPPTATTSIESLCRSIQKELIYVKEKQERGTTRQILTAGEDAENVLACYRRIQGYLQRLTLNANLSMWKIVDEQATNSRVDRLSPSLSACYNSKQATELKRGECTAGTRVDVLAQMHSWAHDRAAGSIYWLNGMAGTGKTTIAYSLCAELDHAHKLAASFFCSRSLPECRDVTQIVPSIAYQLARFSRPFRCALSRVLEANQDVHTQLLRIQFEKLVVKPLEEVRETLPEDLVVVIDALDECDSKKSTRQILEALLTKTSDLPVKFFMASRPEPEIRDQMKKQLGRRAISRLVLHELDKGTVQGDIKTYLWAALEPIKPSEAEIVALTERAGILFIYAATVVRYIGYDDFSKNPRKRLENVLGSSTLSGNNPYKEIDDLYRLILQAAFEDPGLHDEEVSDTKQILYTSLCAHEPLTTSALSGLLGLHDLDRVHAALRPLWSVLHVVESSSLVTTLHASFPDYMFDATRSEKYHCDPAAHDHTLTRHCFDCIQNTRPQFNICGLKSSFVPDEMVEDLDAKIETAVSSEMLYACRYWATHLARAKGLPDVTERMYAFFSSRLLLWMEVLNLTKRMKVGLEMMQQAMGWCQRVQSSADLSELMRDASRFMTRFTSNPVSQYTPHIYVSMLPTWPGSSPIGKHYARRMQGIIPRGTAIARRSLALVATWPLEGEVHCVAWSPDGTRIAVIIGGLIYLHDSLTGRLVLDPVNQTTHSAVSIGFSFDGTRMVSGSSDGMIRAWNLLSGKKIFGPLKGHVGSVTSIAFSPDGARLVSGSNDCTIRIWDARSGKKRLGPFKGHTSALASVAFSPDGTRIASGSNDNTIRIWDAQSGQMVLGPLKGHTDSVTSVAFSPDGTRIVSGSFDSTIRVWDAQSGQMVLGPLKGHTDSVRSVAFSPDGTRIVSGSGDKTIRMWDAQSGQTVLDPLKGHTDSVRSVAFSPDGTRIVSGSGDKTIRMWDAQSGQTVLGPLEGHTYWVASVAFSPNGTRIASGSNDNTIRIWDAQSGQMVLGPLKGHTDRVTSVAFSPDGTRIVSGSFDSTIRVWDAQSGQTVLGPLKGHTDWVTSVAFSPDGTRIVSGSEDKTIRMWDAQSRQTVLGPLEGHTHWVTSLTFSPDGTRIVSGSGDRTIRMWGAQTGQTVLGPLEGHTDWVTSVAFSPDGTRIVSGSGDKTIRMWDAQSGQTVLSPLEGHTHWVTSVAFSPDGTRIVSGSSDKTIRMWNAQSGQTVLGPLEGHTHWVTSVAFSPDGTRIVSGSHDKTIRMWDARTENTTVSFSSMMLFSSTSP